MSKKQKELELLLEEWDNAISTRDKEDSTFSMGITDTMRTMADELREIVEPTTELSIWYRIGHIIHGLFHLQSNLRRN